MHTEIIPLGTASATPTRDRALSATALQRQGRILLFDCGEGTQFRLMDAGLSPTRIDAIFITHLHGDHFFGLPGLLASLSLHHRSEAMTIVGPEGLGAILEIIPGVGHHELTFPLEVVEFSAAFPKRTVFETDEYRVTARPIDHRVTAAGFRFEEFPRPGSLDVEKARSLGITEYEDFGLLKKGRTVRTADGRTVSPSDVLGPEKPGASFAYVLDSRPVQSAIELARGVDLLFHEATFLHEDSDRAESTGHSTAREAAEVALEAGARQLLLAHFSARYTDATVLVDEARRVFKNTEAAVELKRYRLQADHQHEPE
jgi:ribonuclease Z